MSIAKGGSIIAALALILFTIASQNDSKTQNDVPKKLAGPEPNTINAPAIQSSPVQPEQYQLVGKSSSAVSEVSGNRSAPDPVATDQKGSLPSFDCSKAGSSVEHFVCNDAKLARLDVDLASLFKRVSNESRNKDEVVRDQHNWLKNVRNKCGDADCVRVAYEAQIDALKAMASQGGAQ